jgi:hypothetical protein
MNTPVKGRNGRLSVATALRYGLITILTATLLTRLVTAQGRWSNRHLILQTYDPKAMAPPLILPDAYNLAAAKANPTGGIGGSNNDYYCVAASCLSLTNNGQTGWEFRFFGTNREPIKVVVYFDREVVVKPQR